jgi:hypothetical protein
MRTPPRSIQRGIGRISAQSLQSTLDAAELVSDRAPAVSELADGLSRFSRFPAWLLARITAANEIEGVDNKWEYEWTEVRLNDSYGVADQLLTSEDYGEAVNICELENDGADTEGPGWDLNNAPGTFNIRPIAGIVQLWPYRDTTGAFRWVFWAGNVLDGECDEEEEEP